MTNQESAELTEPCVGAFDDPASSVGPEFPAILVPAVFAVLAIWNDEVDPRFLSRSRSGVRFPSDQECIFEELFLKIWRQMTPLAVPTESRRPTHLRLQPL